MSRNDVIIVSSVSCIYNLGSPEDYEELLIFLVQGENYEREGLLLDLVKLQYERNDYEFIRGRFRVRGECLDIFPSYTTEAIRIEFDGDLITRISKFEPC